jgi:phi13 family phage major tail protein
MAKIGLRYPVYKSGSKSGVIGKAIQADINIQVNEVKLPADDTIAETDRSFKEGKLTLGVDDLSDVIQKDFLGHAISEDGELTANGDDTSPFVGVGFFGVKRVNNVSKYRAIWLPKVQFAEPNDTNSTKGENTSFSTPTMDGTIMLDDEGNWKYEQTFATVEEAKAYLHEKAEITPGP